MGRVAPVRKFYRAGKIANRELRYRLFLLAVIFICVIFVFSVMAVNIHNGAAVNSALSRATQTAERFYAHINKTLVLVQKASRSNALGSWFSDEENQEKKKNAYYEMLDYSNVLSNPHLYFGIQDSLGDFSFQPGTTFDQFAPYKKLDPGVPKDAWYFECAASDKDYLLNFDIDLDSRIWKLWLNHKVTVDSKLAGVFCAAFEIDDLYRELFAGYDAERERGFVVDESGAVLMSSDAVDYFSRETVTYIGDICEDPKFTSMFEKIVADKEPSASRAVAVKNSSGPFRYNAVMRIPETGWSVVVILDSDYLTGLAGVVNFLPLPLALLVSMIIYAVASSIHTSRLVFRPITRLTRSIAKAEIDNPQIYGSDRADEIGDLARTIRESRNRLNATYSILFKMNQDKEAQERLLYAVNETAAVLLASSEGENNFRKSILRAMRTLGECLDIDRVSIWQTKMIDDIAHYVPKYEWWDNTHKEQKSLFDSDKLRCFNCSEWTEKFMRGECIGGPAKDLTEAGQDLLSYNNLKSVLLIPIHLHETFWGFINFGDSQKERGFYEEEINILRSASLMMVSAVEHNVQTNKINNVRERARLMLNTTPLACYLFDRDCRIYDCNDETLQIFGLKNKAEYIDNFFKLSPEYQSDGSLSRDLAVSHIQTAFDMGKHTFHWTHQALDGEPIPSEVTLVRVPFRNDYAVAGYTRDLREHVKMMREIERKDELLLTMNHASALLLQSDIGRFDSNMFDCLNTVAKALDVDRVYLWRNHTKDGRLYSSRIYEWSEIVEPQQEKEFAQERLFGDYLSIDERLAAGLSVNAIVREMPPEEREFFVGQNILSILLLPIFIKDELWGFVGFDDCQNERRFSESEESILRSGGLLMANVLLRNEDAEIIHRTNRTLKEQAHWYKSLLDGIPIPITVTDMNMKIAFINKASAGAFCMDREDVIGNHCGIWNGPICDTPDCAVARLKQGLNQTFFKSGGLSYKVESQIIRDLDGEAIGYLEMTYDVTEVENLARRQADSENEAKTMFLANMSHEMRTPLNAIVGLSELALTSEKLDEDIQSSLVKIHNAGAILVSTVNDILDISKIEAGKLDLVLAEYELSSLINDAITLNAARMEEKTLKFILDIENDLPSRLYGDELRVKEILNNLLSNAFKYTREGSVELGVRCEREDETVWLSAWVKDTGIGIHQKSIDRLFNDYVQLDKHSNRRIQGTGLGLAITKRLVELMEGEVTVESEYGKGSTFSIKVRQKYVSDETIGPDMVQNLKNFRYIERKRRKNLRFGYLNMSYARVLVVDDIDINLDVARGMLKPYKMVVDCVMSGQEAVDIIRAEKQKYDAIFMDHMMPIMDGIEAVRIIREEIGTEYAKTIPVIALTANAIIGNEEKFLKAGFQAFISKPIELPRLDAVLREWVRDEEREKLLKEKEINISGELVRDTRSGADRRRRADRRSGIDRRIFGSNVAGLDLAKGMARFGNDRETYLEVMRSFAAGTRPLLDRIREPDSISPGDYGIIVHGIKGSSRGIGALSLGDKAEALEHAAKNGDRDFITANHGDFIAAIEQLLEGIEHSLRGQKRENPKPKKEKPDGEILKKLLAACRDYNMDEADAAIAEIVKWDYEADDGLAAWLKENVDLMNFTEVENRLSALVNGPVQ